MPEDTNDLDLIDDEDPSFFEEESNDNLAGPEKSKERFVALLGDGTVVDKETGEVLDDPNSSPATDDSGDETDPGDGSFTPDASKEISRETDEPVSSDAGEVACRETEVPASPEPEKPDSDAILNKLMKAANHKSVRELCEFSRSYADMNYQEDFAYLVGRIQEIVKKYRERGFVANISSAVDDLIELSGLMVSLSEPLGFLEGCFEEAEEIRKLAKSAFYLEAKKLKVDGWKVTDKDAEHIGRTLARPYIESKGQADIQARMLRNLWYGTRHLIDMLNATIMRAGSEVKYIELAESAAHRDKSDPTDFDPKSTHKEDCDALQADFDKKYNEPPKPDFNPDAEEPKKEDDGWSDDEIEF